jgi:diacylglycerol kinase family enzyme
VLFVNPASGGGKAARAGLVEQALARSIDVVVLHPGEHLGELVAGAVADGADALGVAGGDGSLAVVAAVAAANDLPFVCVPSGTRNHFALDLGVDRRDLVGSLDAFVDGIERRIDAAEVDGRLFLNNVSLGLYGDAVRRPGYRDAKMQTLLATARDVLGPSAPIPELRLVDDEGREHRGPAVILVSNNPYALARPPAPTTRPRLDGGELGIIVLDRPQAGPVPGRAWSAPRFELTIGVRAHAGVDGEPLDLDPPVAFRIRPGALRVRISSHHPGVSPSGRWP